MSKLRDIFNPTVNQQLEQYKFMLEAFKEDRCTCSECDFMKVIDVGMLHDEYCAKGKPNKFANSKRCEHFQEEKRKVSIKKLSEEIEKLEEEVKKGNGEKRGSYEYRI